MLRKKERKKIKLKDREVKRKKETDRQTDGQTDEKEINPRDTCYGAPFQSIFKQP